MTKANLFWFFRALLLPDYPAALNYPGWIISFIAEVGLALWLVIKGVRARPTTGQPT